MMAQFEAVKRKHPDKIIFFRMGDFFEMFGRDAVRASAILQIQLTKRDKKSENATDMCGVPAHSMEKYLRRLLGAGEKVVICDQVEDPADAKGLVKREVVRIATPGTSFELSEENPGQNNFLASIFIHQKQVGVIFTDVSTGEVWYDGYSSKNESGKTTSLISMFNPTEILCNGKTADWLSSVCPASLIQDPRLEILENYCFDHESSERMILEMYGLSSLDGLGFPVDNISLISAFGGVLAYLRENRQGEATKLSVPLLVSSENRMILDDVTVKNLELLNNSYDGANTHTLFSILNATSTPMGERLLKNWITRPLKDRAEIETRHDILEELISHTIEAEALRGILTVIGDMERTVSKLSLGMAGPQDLAKIRQSLGKMPEIKKTIAGLSGEWFRDLLKNFPNHEEEHRLLCEQLVEVPARKVGEGDVIAPGSNQELDRLRSLRENAEVSLNKLEARERESSGINGLKVKFNKVFGYYIEISKANKISVPDRYIRKQTLVNAERYVTQELNEMEEEILTAEDKILHIETKLLDSLRERLTISVESFRHQAGRLAEIDVLLSLSLKARENRYIRPELTDEIGIELKDSRHPVIEQINPEKNPFIPNDLLIGFDRDNIHVITGPNMGGKSTFMRQVALVLIMNQIGSFVPASSGKLGIADCVYTRVGASDNISRGQSTFMTEMAETAAILNRFNQRSLIVLDEIGRGTGTYDGMGIAKAIIEYLSKTKALVLFATHYHELSELEENHSNVRNYCVGVREEKGKITFLCKIQRGMAEKSYGVHVAKMAGLPKEIIDSAEKFVGNSTQYIHGKPITSDKTFKEPTAHYAGDLFSSRNLEIVEKIKVLDLDDLKPLEAFKLLCEFKEELI